MSSYFVYILASGKNGTLYVGMTNNITKRVFEHKQKFIKSFTQKYNVSQLVYAEEFGNPQDALWRERCIKRWKRKWKIRLIEEKNPQWIDLYKIL
ncbi:MAG: GIY-YIG nuclease family protein [Rickettsiales bacterium]